MIGLPISRGYRVTLSLRFGRAETFSCDDFTVTRDKRTGTLTGLSAERSRGFDYVRLDDVSAIRSIQIIRLRGLTGREIVWWTFALGVAALLRFALHWI